MFLANDVDLRRIYERFANDLIYYVHADGSDEKVKLQLNLLFRSISERPPCQDFHGRNSEIEQCKCDIFFYPKGRLEFNSIKPTN